MLKTRISERSMLRRKVMDASKASIKAIAE